MFMHLTNFSLNKQSENFTNEDEVEDIYEPNNASKRTLTSLYKQIEQIKSPESVELLKENITKACTGTAALLQNMIMHNQNEFLKKNEEVKGMPF